MTCWYCYWGWPKQVADIYDRYIGAAGESAMEYGPAHIVWADENFDHENVQWCLDHFDEYSDPSRHSPDELAAVRKSLEEMLLLDDDVRDPCPEEYEDDEDNDPKDFPPPAGLTMVRH